MDVLGGAGQVELNLFRSQYDEGLQVHALASGLRVNSASDDPSGYAISQTIQTKVSGLQQGVQNVQDANNLLTVADSTLATVQEILQRIHSLIVQASSDINSQEQLSSIQSEIGQLLQEVNKIAGDAKFNGINLLDGSLSSSTGSSPSVQQVTPELNPDGSIPSSDVYDANGSGTHNPGPLMFNPVYDQPGFVPGFIEMQVLSYSTDPTDPVTGPLGVPGVIVKVTEFSTDPNFDGANGAQEQVSYAAFATGTGPDQGTGSPLFIGNANGSQNMLEFDLANLSQQDVGVAMAFETSNGQPAAPANAHPLMINSGGDEGSVVSVNLPGVSTSDLGISDITVLTPSTVDWLNNPTGQSTSNAVATDDAEIRVQSALDQISGARAQIGAQTVALQQDANDASVQMVNQTASESAIRDANIAQTTTAFTKDQILSQVGMSVLSQMQSDASLVIQLFNNIGLPSNTAANKPA